MTALEKKTFSLWDLANPTRFLSILDKIMMPLIVLTVIAFAAGLYLTFYVAPDDYQQGATVKIMFVHVPTAWLAMFAYTMMAISSLGTLVWKHPLADVSAKAAGPLGAAFTFLALVTGSLWGKPMWGTWWVWDARLTSMLVLLIIYLGLMALWRTIDDPIRAGKAAAILTLVGFINVPIIKFSVDWWSTLHQPASVITMEGPKNAQLHSDSAAGDGRGLYSAVHRASFQGDAQRDPPPPHPHHANAGRTQGRIRQWRRCGPVHSIGPRPGSRPIGDRHVRKLCRLHSRILRSCHRNGAAARHVGRHRWTLASQNPGGAGIAGHSPPIRSPQPIRKFLIAEKVKDERTRTYLRAGRQCRKR